MYKKRKSKKYKLIAAISILAIIVQAIYPIIPLFPSFGKKKIVSANDDILSTNEKEKVMFVNTNPEFKVEFGNKEQADVPFVRFEALASGENPFDKEKNQQIKETMIERLESAVFGEKQHGIEFSLKEAGVSKLENNGSGSPPNGRAGNSKPTQETKGSRFNLEPTQGSNPKSTQGNSQIIETKGSRFNLEPTQTQGPETTQVETKGSRFNLEPTQGKGWLENQETLSGSLTASSSAAADSESSLPAGRLGGMTNSNNTSSTTDQSVLEAQAELQAEEQVYKVLNDQLDQMISEKVGAPGQEEDSSGIKLDNIGKYRDQLKQQILDQLTQEQQVRATTQITQIENPEDKNSKKDIVKNPDVIPGIDADYRIMEEKGLKEEIVIKNNEGFSRECVEKKVEEMSKSHLPAEASAQAGSPIPNPNEASSSNDKIYLDPPVKPEDDNITKPEDDNITKPGNDSTTKPGDDSTTKPGDDSTTKPGDDNTVPPSPAATDGQSKPGDDNKNACSLPKNTFTFSLKLDPGVAMRHAIGTTNGKPHGITYFTDEKGKYLFHFAPLYAVDGKGVRTNAVRLEIAPDKQSDSANDDNKIGMENGKWKMENNMDGSLTEKKIGVLDNQFINSLSNDAKFRKIADVSRIGTTNQSSLCADKAVSQRRALWNNITAAPGGYLGNTEYSGGAGETYQKRPQTIPSDSQRITLRDNSDSKDLSASENNTERRLYRSSSEDRETIEAGKRNDTLSRAVARDTMENGELRIENKSESSNSESNFPFSIFHFPFDINTAKAEETTNQEQQTYTMKVIVDLNWLLSPDRQFPIKIDPSIVHDSKAEFDAGNALNRVESLADPKVDINNPSGGNDQYTKLLLHADGADASTTFTGSEIPLSQRKNITVYGGAQIDTAQSEFGGASAYFDGTGDFITAPNNNDWNFGTSDFTIDFWVRRNGDEADYGGIVSTATSTPSVTGWALYWGAAGSGTTNKILLASNASGAWAGDITSSTTVANTTWTHVALARSGNTLTMYFNGLSVGSKDVTGYTYNSAGSGLFIGRIYTDVDNYYHAGWIDELRISKGIARWKSGFTPPTKAYDFKKPDGRYDSSVLDLGADLSSIDSLQWTENGVRTGDGETPYSSTNLVGQWNFNETSGTNAADATGHGLTAALTGFSDTSGQDVVAGSGWTANNGKWPRSGPGGLMLDGSNDDVTVADNDALDITSGTLEAWIKTSNPGSSYRSIVARQYHYSMFLQDGELGFFDWNTSTWRGSGTYLNDGNWHHVAVTFQSGTASGTTMYVDGRTVGANTMTIVAGHETSPFSIGNGNGTQYVNGVIDSVRLYSRVLPADEILADAQVGNIEFQTRTGTDNTPDDGTGWEAWKPSGVGTETQIDSMDSSEDNTRVYDWGVSNVGVNQNWVKKNNVIPGPSDTTSTDGRIPVGTATKGDELGAYEPTVIKDGSTYKMWYSGLSVSNSHYRIYYATSPDGLTWTKYNNTIPDDSDTTSTDGRIPVGTAGKGDASGAYYPTVIKDGSTYKMWYTGSDGTNYRIYYATSPDGLTWTKYNNVAPSNSDTTSTDGRIPVGTAGKGDATVAYSSTVIKDGSTYKMWYTGSDGTNWRIYYATSPDGLTWTKYNNVAPSNSDTTSTDGRIPLGTAGKGDASTTQHPAVIRDGSTYKMWYTGDNAAIYYATSPDGLTWTKYNNVAPSNSDTTSTDGRIPRAATGTRGDSSYVFGSTVIKDGSSYKIWYGGSYGQTFFRTYYATMSPLPVAESTETIVKAEGAGSEKFSLGAAQGDTGTVGIWHMDETGGSGAYIKDATSTGNNGTPTGTTLVDGIFGKARSFDGNNDVINVGTDASLDFGNNGSFTFSGWVKPTTLVDYAGFVGKDAAGRASPYSIMTVFMANGRLAFYNSTGPTWSDICPAGSVVTGVWQHVAFSYNGTNITGYVNGSSCGSVAVTYTDDASHEVTIGSWTTSAGYDYNGLMDEVKISKLARSAEEISEEYRLGRDRQFNSVISSTDLSGKTKLPFWVAGDRAGTYLEVTVGESAYANGEPDANTVGLWHLDEQSGSGAYVRDSSGAGHNATPTGTTVSEGRIGKARYFNGSSDYISTANSADWNFGSGDFAIDAWVRLNSTVGAAIIANLHEVGSYEGFVLYASAGVLSFDISTNGTSWNHRLNDSVTLNINQWYHIAVVRSGTTLYLYKDGALVTSQAVASETIVNASTTLRAGSDGSNYLNGYIDELRISKGIARSASDIRQAYEAGLRTHPITIDFQAKLDAGDLITGSGDTSFTVDDTPYLPTTNKADTLYIGDKVIVKENYDGTEYLAQGTVTAVTAASGAVTVASWDASSTFPSGGQTGFSANASVFKWQREWMDVTAPLSSQINAVTRLTLRCTDGLEGRTVYLDDFESGGPYLTAPAATGNVTSTVQRYMQYRAIFSTTNWFDPAHEVGPTSPYLSGVTVNYTSGPTTDQLMRNGKWFSAAGVKQGFWWAK